MDLEGYCKTLSKKELLNLAIRICQNALPIWDDYSLENKLEYTDTVVGLHHKIRKELLSDSIQLFRRKYLLRRSFENDLKKLLEEFTDPVAAMQDSDWELPYSVKCVFHSVYNLLDGVKEPITIFNQETHYVSINQSADALKSSGLMNFDQIHDIIYSYR
jgi:hypothetical protein